MLQDSFALARRKAVFGEGGEHLGIGVRSGNRSFEPVGYEFFQRVHICCKALIGGLRLLLPLSLRTLLGANLAPNWHEYPEPDRARRYSMPPPPDVGLGRV